MATIDETTAADLEALVDALDSASFRLPVDDRADRESARRDLSVGIRRYLLPRVTDDDAPAVGLVVGLTGTGKSTLINSLAERRISAASALRPTTTEPVIWAHRRHAGRYWQEFVGQLEEQLGPSAEIIVEEDDLVDNLTLVDSPAPGGDNAAALLGMADLAIVVASATRYADSQAWDLLRRIRGRGLPMLFVLNRLPRDASSSQAVIEDYVAKLAERGFLPRPDPSLLFAVYEHRIDASTDGLPPGSVAALRKELGELGDPSFREKLTENAKRALFTDLARQATQVATFVRQEAKLGRELLAMGERAYNARIAAIDSDLERGKYSDLAAVWDPDRLGKLLARHIAIGAQETAAAWSEHPIGRRIVQAYDRELWRSSEDAVANATKAVTSWTTALEQLAVDRSSRRRLRRRTRRKMGAVLRRSALAGSEEPLPEVVTKRYGSRGAIAVVRAARGALLDALGEAFQADASRFRAAVGPVERLEVLGGLLDDNAGALGVKK